MVAFLLCLGEAAFVAERLLATRPVADALMCLMHRLEGGFSAAKPFFWVLDLVLSTPKGAPALLELGAMRLLVQCMAGTDPDLQVSAAFFAAQLCSGECALDAATQAVSFGACRAAVNVLLRSIGDPAESPPSARRSMRHRAAQWGC